VCSCAERRGAAEFGECSRIEKSLITQVSFQSPSEAASSRGTRHGDKTSRKLTLFVWLLVPVCAYPLFGQGNAKTLSPAEAYKAALAPFTEARSQPNDLTDADKYALGIGIAQASRDCLTLSSDVSSLAGDAKELFALGQLCIFGQQFEPARAALVSYLAIPQPPQREQALLLLARAFLGLKEPDSAAGQVRTLLLDYPYDARIHGAIDQIIDSSEGGPRNILALDLCATQNAATLPLLRKRIALQGTEGSASAATLFADSVRCAALTQSSNILDTLEDLAAIVQMPHWAGTADLAPMQAALDRQQMVGKRAPAVSLRGWVLGANGLVPRTVSLKRGTELLVPFTLWSPSTPDMVRDLAKYAPPRSTYAITSWRANTGREDVRSNEVLEGLRSWQRSFPKSVSILIVPDGVLRDFHSDVFPAGILVRDGVVVSNLLLSGEGAERLVVNALAGNGGAP
jgi:hypothetical protein